MIKKIALFLASTSLACVVPASTFTAPKMGGFEALSAERSIGNPDTYDGYNFFGGCIVEPTVIWDIVDTPDGDIYIENYSRFTFGNWLPSRVAPFYDVNADLAFTDYYGDYSTAMYVNINTYSRGVSDVYLYRRDFSCTPELDTGFDFYERNVYQWRVFQDTPIIVPYAFLEQFLLGLSLDPDGNTAEFVGNLWAYNFTAHTFDRYSLSLLSDSGPRLPDTIDPNSLNSIFGVENSRYVYYDNEQYGYDPLVYKGGWVFCRFDLCWATNAVEDSMLVYSNEYTSEELLEILRTVSPAQLSVDARILWSKFYGDTIYLEPINPPSLIFDTVEGFLDTEFMPEFSFGDLLLIVLGVMVFGAFLKVFLGG